MRAARRIAGPFGEEYAFVLVHSRGVQAHLSNSGEHAGEKESGPRESE